MIFKFKQKKVSKYTDIEQSFKNVRRRRWNLKRILKVLFSIQFIAHLASVISIIGIYFSDKDWKFSYNKWGDWLAVLGALVLLLIGIHNLWRDFKEDTGTLVNYEELHDLLTVARFEAESSIINIGGDLSWLSKDINTFKEIKDEHPDIQIKIYYDKHKLSSKTKKLIMQLQEENSIQLIPYPDGMDTPSVRCMIIDYDYSEIENCRIYVYPKKDRESGNNHEKDKFEWQEYTIESNPNLYDAISSFLKVLDQASKHRLVVGVSGINNCGKTSIVNACEKILEKNFTVKVIEDIATNINVTDGDYYIINERIIFNQLFDILHDHDEEIIIFDRTPFDNFVYMLMREQMVKKTIFKPRKNSDLIMEYGKLIREMMQYFDIVYMIQRKKEPVHVSTRLVSAKERECVIKLYNELGNEYLPNNVCTKKIGKDSFEKDVEEVAQLLAKDIQNHYYTY